MLTLIRALPFAALLALASPAASAQTDTAPPPETAKAEATQAPKTDKPAAPAATDVTRLVVMAPAPVATGWYAELKSWQTGIGALIGSVGGLLAILWGAMRNARHNRDRDDHIRDQDRRALAALLAAEVRVLKAACKMRQTWCKNNLRQDYIEIDKLPAGFKLPDWRAFASTIQNHGLLGVEIADRLYGLFTLASEVFETMDFIRPDHVRVRTHRESLLMLARAALHLQRRLERIAEGKST